MEKPSPSPSPLAVRLPPGFRFHPTDEELVIQYLWRKAFFYPLPAAVIPEANLSRIDPWDLPDLELWLNLVGANGRKGGGQPERYFFHLIAAKSSRSSRATASGYWKAAGKEKKITASKSNHVVGTKKTLVFYHGRPPAGHRTEWVMHEYSLAGTIPLPPEQAKQWVLCRMFIKKTSAEISGYRGFIDFMGEKRRRRGCSSSSSSDLSCVTEIEDGSSGGESSGCCSPP
ncbi:NAC domain-containing protein 68 [Apostasia shenzhenica]|uniref:NAC domain-containing protein 68 n=1 Tax=Apostasia shenzhenica TaxID=1088818 RepID=A0A2H9ZWB6_9ASPA|nr:NAC domain-containing protein 68 [Apostasia shenzhenica]